MASRAELAADIVAGNTRKAIPESTYSKTLAGEFETLLKKHPDYESVQFDPAVHLSYYSADPLDQHKFHNTRRITMDELGLTHKLQVSPIGVSDPFPLFTDEAVDIMKMELLRKDTFLQHARISYNSSSGMDCLVRGWVKDGDNTMCPFVHAAWTHPKTMELVSIMAGVELEVVMDYEIAHTNIAMTDDAVAAEQRADHQKRQRERSLTGEDSGDDIPAVVGWHNDSFPFVCVLMMSDTTNMIGGETYLRMGDNSIAKVSGPQRGSGAILQGRLIQHLAPKPIGASERITMVTSYRPKNPTAHDGSVLSTVKPEINWGSAYNPFYRSWVDYRAGVVKARFDALSAAMKKAETFDKAAATEALKDIEAYVRKTYKEMEVSTEEWEAVMSRG